jgi:hypothetical protein
MVSMGWRRSLPGIEFAVTFFVGCGIFAIAVLPEPELQQRRRLAVVAASFVGVGLIGYFLDEIVFTALGAATIPPLTLYYRTKDQRKRIETLEGKNEELIEAVRKREETSTSLRTAIDRLRDDVTNLRDLDTTHLQALMDIARDNLTSVVESLWEFYRLELVRVYAEPPTDVKIHQTRLVVIFS